MPFKPIQKLNITRTLSTGEGISVGVLAQNRQGVFFQYEESYISRFGNLSPFTLQANTQIQIAPEQPHHGIHGVFDDSLPDGWGRLLQDRIFRQNGILPAQVTAMDRLAMVGDRGMGALSFLPVSEFSSKVCSEFDLATLGLEAETLFDESLYAHKEQDNMDGHTQQVLAALVAGGSSGGGRPKAQVYMQSSDMKHCRTFAQPGDEAWLVKFTSKNLPLGHEEGLCEAVYLQMAEQANCQPPIWQLIEAPENSGAEAWLALKRFDYLPPHQGAPQKPDMANNQNAGRLHMHSVCGLLDADFRTPSLDYFDLIKASRQLCKSPAVGQLQFRRAVFNLLAANQDDHSKNWAFLQLDNGQWQVAPFYDVTYSPHPFNEHATAFGGYGKAPPLKVMQKLAASAGFAKWRDAQQCIYEVSEALSQFASIAKQQGISKTTVSAIEKTLIRRRQENAEFFI
ncbi:MAG: type II toxin-antitoxin system HipA family toxin [Piscirickettsiaceae bacterium CG_4_9_14_3_um_filter_43_564]|nr:type II toxin-antitoxin system HipA family toxin [Thiomicrospira sp.]OIP96511.1 MAG: phosphatidylinositol kinase [Thiomicrospira sp. CG2_30_44_34]PIQ02931.1 MAG: phosphatidylinositol kinase [Piscirickettsiaceae bacterium CG18_big_fil_WC_8_21_14_2_50_44_103]PIU38962.1 MAG: type II toxin-antitoxin system HipA family toxin [Piscirickettsiaceae bacterium CG07_land_8_20_14_0_80_44_28]PIW57483.1 MAG: type II toxin-antitoxin system HipA family toxin [Piscirickettsiaceae bacterium CG12_big_fil_rev_8